ncbi:hypothetical protein TrRE_jg10493, partial [Triparma retinervis]
HIRLLRPYLAAIRHKGEDEEGSCKEIQGYEWGESKGLEGGR